MTAQFSLTIDCSNAAFGETAGERGLEIARLLREVARRIEGGVADNMRFALQDLNGNRVGEANMTGGRK